MQAIFSSTILVFLLTTFLSEPISANEMWIKFDSIDNSSNTLPMFKVASPTTKYSTKPTDRHVIKNEYYSNNVLKKSTSFLGQLKDGLEKEYYSNGNLMVKTYYLNGNKHGVETIYDESGEVFKKTFYRNGIKQE